MVNTAPTRFHRQQASDLSAPFAVNSFTVYCISFLQGERGPQGEKGSQGPKVTEFDSAVNSLVIIYSN